MLRFKDNQGNKFPIWEKEKFIDVCDTITDFVAAGSFASLRKNVKYETEPNYAQLIRTTDLKNGITNDNAIYVNKEAFDFLRKVNLDKESIILPNVGNCGEVYYISPQKLPLSHNVLGPNAILCRSSTASNYFLGQLFFHKSFQNKIKIITASTGQPKFNKTELKQIVLNIPCLQEQEKIADFLSSYDDMIDITSKRLQALQKRKLGLLQGIFSQTLRFRDSDGQEFPPWRPSQLGKETIIERGGSPRPISKYLTDSPDGINWIKIGDAPVDGNVISSVKEKITPIGASKSRMVKKGDLILSNSMSYGRPYLLAVDGCIHDGWLVIRNHINAFDINFLLQLLSSSYVKSQYEKLSNQGVVSNLNKELVKSVRIMIPCMEEQRRIAEFLGWVDQGIELESQRLETMKTIKKGLLQQMFI